MAFVVVVVVFYFISKHTITELYSTVHPEVKAKSTKTKLYPCMFLKPDKVKVLSFFKYFH